MTDLNFTDCMHDAPPRSGLIDRMLECNTFTSGPGVPSDGGKFAGGVLVRDGHVVFVPQNPATVGMYDPNTSTVRSKPAYTLSQPLAPSWNVALLPYYNKY